MPSKRRITAVLDSYSKLVAIDLFRNLDADATSKIFTEFSKKYAHLFSSELKMQSDVATSLFIFLVGLVSIAF